MKPAPRHLRFLFPAALLAAPLAAGAAAGAAAAPAAPSEVWLSFGLDRIEVLRHAPFADIPLWQYLASLLYVFLAFYLSKGLDAFIANRVRVRPPARRRSCPAPRASPG